jgi:hypothetical protein
MTTSKRRLSAEALRLFGAASLAALLCACRTLPAPAPTPDASATVSPASERASAFACADGERAMQRDALYFGRSRRDGGTVSDAQWRAFVDDAIVPRFPDGFTALAAEGHWRAGDGAIVGEATQMVIVLHAGDAAAQRAIEEIAAQYKREFAQESVLRERTTACVRF